MRICISGRTLDDFEMLITGSVTGWGEWCSMQWGRLLWSGLWSWLWILLPASVGRKCTCTFASTQRLWRLCCAIVPMKTSGDVVLTKHSRVWWYRSLLLFMSGKLNTPPLFFSDLGTRFLHLILRFPHCGARKPAFGHFGHIQGQAHVGLFQLYSTSLPCHRCRHVEYLQELSWCFKHWDVAMTLTIYASVPTSKLSYACFFHCRGSLTGNLTAKMPEHTTSWCSILRTVRTNAFTDHGCSLFGQQTIGHVALGVHWLILIWLIDGRWPWYGETHIELHAAAYSCCFKSYGRYWNVHAGSCVWWLHRQPRGRLTGACVLPVCQYVMYSIKRLPIVQISIRLDLAEVVVYPWFAGVELKRKMITKRCGKTWGLYS